MNSYEKATPKVFIDPSVTNILDSKELASDMEELGISAQSIESTSVYLDGKAHLSYKGSQTPKWLDRLLHGSSEINIGKGSVIRIAANLRGKPRTSDEMNNTLRHELEHVAQTDRRDKKVKVGNAAIWGGAIAAALAGNILTRKQGARTRAAATIAGFGLGQKLGYSVAPHEHDARKAAGLDKINTIK